MSIHSFIFLTLFSFVGFSQTPGITERYSLEGQLKILTGKKFPKGIAFDFSGIVEKVGNNTNTFKIGDEVFGTLDAMKGEALAEYIVVKKERRGNSYLRLRSLFLLTVEERALVAADRECVCGLRYSPARELDVAM